jgi:branched-chain amino acid aminotransferase
VGIETVEQIWLDGEFVPWDQAQVHILTHTLHYGLGVFEGIRCYKCEDGRSAVFRLREHLERLDRSARIVALQVPFSVEKLEQVVLETLRVNKLAEGYIRPIAFLGEGAMGLLPSDNPVRVGVIVWPWGAYLGEEGLERGLERGIRAKVSSYTRHHPNVSMTKSKACGNYVNSILAKVEITRLGYDEAIMLDTSGLVSEGSGENLFVIRGGIVKTPPLSSVLEGVTRDAVIRIARDKGIDVVEQPLTRDELYSADEAFLTGTAAEVTPIREVDDRVIGAGSRGPITRTLQTAFFDVVRGRNRKYETWLTYV